MLNGRRVATFLAGLLMCLWSLAILTAPQSAQAVAARPVGARRQATTAGHVTVLILDMSGSMTTSDPLGIRCSAANAYIDLSGVGDFVGVIDLDGTSATAPATIIAQPAEMATDQDRATLRQTIATRTNNCRPDGYTPTQDALHAAATMLSAATQNGALAGSAILLTDGVPDPNSSAQVSAITSQELPVFAQHNWPVDVIALGPPGVQNGVDYHTFLANISDATAGQFYDDGHGVVPGVSPLNIAPFFVDIFARRNQRTPGPTVAPTTLSGGTVGRDFQVGQYVNHLDIIAVKDQSATAITLQTPSGITVGPGVAGTFVTQDDPYYRIFSIDGPQAGTWRLSAQGSGQFLMDSVAQSGLGVTITSPGASDAAHGLGEPLTISASVTFHNAVLPSGQFTVAATVAFAGSSATPIPNRDITLTETPAGSGIYQGQVTIPTDAPPGSYSVTVSVSQVSATPIASATVTLGLQRLPRPVLLAAGQVVSGAATTTIVRYPWPLQGFYSIPYLNFLHGIALGNQPAQPAASFAGDVRLNGQPYCSSHVTATATPLNGGAAVPVTIQGAPGCGAFTVVFPVNASGGYTVAFQTTGAFKDTHGAASVTPLTVRINARDASLGEWGRALALALLEIGIFGMILNFYLRNYPRGTWRVESGSYSRQSGELQGVRQGWQRFVFRNVAKSGELGLPAGLTLHFGSLLSKQMGQRIDVEQSKGANNWGLRATKTITPDGETIVWNGPNGPVTFRFRADGTKSTSSERSREPVAIGPGVSRVVSASDRDRVRRDEERQRERENRDRQRSREKDRRR